MEIEGREIDADDKLDIIIKGSWHLVIKRIAEYYLFVDRSLKNLIKIFSTDTLGINSDNQTIILFSDRGMCCPHNEVV